MKKILTKLKDLIVKIELVDRFLILFMLILFLYTIVGLFTGMTDSKNGDMVDTIIRTSAASIFGYFISSNFIKANKINSTEDSYVSNLDIQVQANDEDLNIPPNNIKESEILSDLSGKSLKTSVTEPLSDQISDGKLQVAIVSAIGGGSLILLFIIKFFIAEISEISVTVSQLRDFVSACIGFLVSYGRTK